MSCGDISKLTSFWFCWFKKTINRKMVLFKFCSYKKSLERQLRLTEENINVKMAEFLNM
jgi:hypothetical protein